MDLISISISGGINPISTQLQSGQDFTIHQNHKIGFYSYCTPELSCTLDLIERITCQEKKVNIYNHLIDIHKNIFFEFQHSWLRNHPTKGSVPESNLD